MSTLKIKRGEAKQYMDKLQMIGNLKCESDPSNKFSWAWVKNFKKFSSIFSSGEKLRRAPETPEVKAFQEEYYEKMKEFNDKYSANIKANGGRYTDEIAKESEELIKDIESRHPDALKQINQLEKELEIYFNEEVDVEVHMVAKPHQPSMTPQQMAANEFMFSESDLIQV